MPIKDPTAWMDDLSVHVDDETILDTAAQLEPEVRFNGSKATLVGWLSVLGMAGGAFGAATLSSGIRASALAFAIYLVAAFVLFRGIKPVTIALIGPVGVWFAVGVVFWSIMLAFVAIPSAHFKATWLAYGASAAGGFFIGMMRGAFSPPSIRDEIWMAWALPLGIISTTIATSLHRGAFGVFDSLGTTRSVPDLVLVGVVAASLFTIPMALVLVSNWSEARALEQMAKLYLHNDNFLPKAISSLDRAIVLAPNEAELYNLRGTAWSRMGESGRAAADWAKVAKLRPKDSVWQMNIGVDHLRRGDPDAAVRALEAALVIDSTNAMVHSNLGNALQRKGELDRALEHYARAIEIRPDYANAYSNRGYTHLLRGDHESALADCDRAIEIDPRLPMAFVNRGHALAARGDRDAAVRSFRNAIELRPGPDVHDEALEGLVALGASLDEDAEDDRL
jgi:Flp pilus assembly protein TadD